jgi:F-box and WD-40 domain protein 1/11
MTRRVIPINDWAPAQEAIYGESSNPSTDPSASTQQQASQYNSDSRNARAGDRSFHNKSLSFPWRHRPKSFILSDDEIPAKLRDLTLDRTQSHAITGQGHSNHAYSQSTSAMAASKLPTGANVETTGGVPAAGGSIRGIFRRASLSLKGMVNRRPSLAASSAATPVFEEREERTFSLRPGTAHSTWHRLRQAASFRHTRSNDTSAAPSPLFDENVFHVPVPGIGGPPIIPRNTGAAARAAAAMQSEFLGYSSSRPSLQSSSLHNKWLTPSTSEDSGNDRESGIGITVNSTDSEPETSEEDLDMRHQDTNISRIDFVSQLPLELAIHVLSHLDATALATASRVSTGWDSIIRNQHIWRESFLREKTSTYATGGNITPGAGLGVPTILPTNDWRQIYRVREELDRRWKEGKAKPVYLNGHLDSIYCLQFDE